MPAAELLAEAMSAAEKIADMSLPAVMMTKEAVNRAYETTLAEGMRFERRVFHAMFALDDQKEGMAAFIGKRAARVSQPLTWPAKTVREALTPRGSSTISRPLEAACGLPVWFSRWPLSLSALF